MRRARTQGGILMVVLLGGASFSGAQDLAKGDEVATASCRGLRVTPIPANTSTNRGFSARDTLDLTFQVQLPAQETPTQVEMRYFTPAGHLYQTVVVPVAPEGSRELERSLPEHPFPVKVAHVSVSPAKGRAGEGTDRERFVDMPALPVAGTVIAQNSLYGAWRAEAWPDGAQSPCSLQFVIRP